MSRQYKPVVCIGPSIAYVPLTQGKWALIDREDAELAGEFMWFAQRNGINFYAVRQVKIADKTYRILGLHRFLLELEGLPIGDHRNRNTLDCRRWNIRPASFSQNAMNRKIRSDNSSGTPGVEWNKRRRRWIVRVGSRGIRKFLGRFSSLEKAIEVRNEYARKMHGDFFPVNQS